MTILDSGLLFWGHLVMMLLITPLMLGTMSSVHTCWWMIQRHMVDIVDLDYW